MTEYIVELFEKNAKKPYSRYKDSLPDYYRPTFINSTECFNGKLVNIPRVKVRYVSNGKLVAVNYVDRHGKQRLRWIKY